MYKMTLSGRKKTQLTEDYASSIAVIGDYIYYIGSGGVIRIKKDGSDRTMIYELPFSHPTVNEMIIYNDNIYLLDYFGLTVVTIDGKDEHIYDDTHDMVGGVAFDGNYLYYTTNANDRNLYRTNLKTMEKECIFTNMIQDIAIAGNNLYFTDIDYHGYYAYDLTTSKRTKVFQDQIVRPNISDGKIIGLNSNIATDSAMTSNALISVDISSGIFTRLSNFKDCEHINVCGEKVLFENGGELYFVNIDGTGLQKID